MSASSSSLSRVLLGGLGVACAGVLLGVATAMAVTVVSPAKTTFLLGGAALLIPTMILEDPQAYWLFLLVLSIPFDITKWLSIGIVDLQALVEAYGEPMSGTIGLEVYLTDVIVLVMLAPWIARVCLRRTMIYFPRIGYLFLCYLGWALLVSLVNAQVLSLSLFELFRQSMYFLFFIYLINNVSTPQQVRTIILAIFLGLIIGAGSVIVFFERGIGTDTVAFAGLHDQQGTSEPSSSHKSTFKGAQNLTVNSSSGGLGSFGALGESQIKRSQGMFRHPAIPAGLCGLVLPVVLAYFMAAKTRRDRIVFFLVYMWGFVALVLTFSRAGLIGFLVGTLVFLAVGARSGLISRRLLALSGGAAALLVIVGMPLLIAYLQTRPDTFSMRFYMFQAALEGYSEHPILGVGLNNSTAAMKPAKQELNEVGIRAPPGEPADSYYLAILAEIGPVGSILFFGFFAKVAALGLRLSREKAVEMKPLLAGMIAGLAAVAAQSFGDGPLAGHSVSGTSWLFAALIVILSRNRMAQSPPPEGRGSAALVGA